MADSMTAQLAMSRTSEHPEVVHAYDAAKGTYHDPVCEMPTAPAYVQLPGTPMPFANLKSGK